jgi:hypothetical protein
MHVKSLPRRNGDTRSVRPDSGCQAYAIAAKRKPDVECRLLCTLRPEHADRSRERVGHHGLAHQCCQSLGTFGSRQAWSPPSLGPRPSGRSCAGFQRTHHRHQSLCVRAAANPDRHATDLDLDRSGTGLDFATPHPPLRNRRRSRIHNCRHELQPFSLRTSSLRFSQLTSPAEQLLQFPSPPPAP